MTFEPFLRSIEEESIASLRRLVEVNSFTRNRAGVLHTGDLCAEMFEPLGFEARRVPSETPDCGDHVFCVKKGSGDASICMVSHLDTVFPPEVEERDGFAWREEGDWI